MKRHAAAPVVALAVAVAALGANILPPRAALALTLIAANDSYSVVHDRTLSVAAPGVLGNDVGLLGSSTAVLDSQPAHGTLTFRANGSFTYVPNAGYIGTDSFRYHAHDVVLLLPINSLPATVTITITNAMPVAANDSYTATTGVQLSVGAPGVMRNDSDADGDALTAAVVSKGGNGSLNLSANGSFTYTSGGSFVGTYSFTYRVSDGIASSNVATVTITVSAPPATPTPAPTPTPTSTPTPTPAPTPTPTPKPTPTPTPTPSLPLPTPSLPLPTPSLPLPTPTLPVPTPTLPVPTPTLPLPTPTLPLPTPTLPLPTPTLPLPTPTLPVSTPGASPTPSPSGSVGPTGSPPPTSQPPGSAAPGGGTSGPGGGSAAGPFGVGGVDLGPTFGLVGAGFGGFDGGIDWAVPALALTVPGILLILAILAQSVVGAVWLPFVRRWLGAFGVRRRKAESRDAA